MSYLSILSNLWGGNKLQQNIPLEAEEIDLERGADEKLISDPKAGIDDDSDEECDDKKAKRPSKLKQITAIALSASAAFATNYLDCNPIITVGSAALFSSAGKTVLRNIPIKYRYPLVIALTALGFVADYYNPVNLNIGPVCATLLFSCLSRTQKLYLLGKLSKDL